MKKQKKCKAHFEAIEDRVMKIWKSTEISVSRAKLQGLTVDALVPSAEEGRGSLRKAAGSREQAIEPQISEWGNPLERTSNIRR
jgi:hypothetical protein